MILRLFSIYRPIDLIFLLKAENSRKRRKFKIIKSKNLHVTYDTLVDNVTTPPPSLKERHISIECL
jgi:hypothetical protein